MKIRYVSDNIYPVYLAQILIDYKTKYAYEDQFFTQDVVNKLSGLQKFNGLEKFTQIFL